MKASFRKYWRYLTLFLLSFTFVFSCSEDPVEPPSKPKATCVAASEAIVGWWPLDELGTTAQDLVAGNNGDYGGNPSEAGGKVAGAVRFDGVDDCVEVRDPGVGWAYDFEGSFTLEAWVMRESDQTSQQIIVGKAYAYVLAFREGRPIGYISYVSEAYGVTKVPIGEWHHIATTYDQDAKTLKVFLDGEINGAGTTEGQSAGVNDLPLNIGGLFSSTGGVNPEQFFDGIIDEVSVYDSALSITEIRELFNCGSRGKCKQ